MAVSHDQIKDLLGQGLSNETVASAVGCSPSYISQLLADEQFAAEVTKHRVENLAKHNRTDNKLDRIEEQLIDNLAEAVESKRIYKPQETLAAFRIINAARRRGASSTPNNTPAGGIVNLVIPVVVQQQFVTNSSREVVAVAEKSLVTITPEQLVETVKAHSNETDTAKYDKLLGRMPSAAIDRNGKVL